MSDAPKIVLDRLRAAAPREVHPDADVLSAFAEQALSGAEREDVVRHLARCGDCREIVALSLPPLEAVAPPQAISERTSPRRTSDRPQSWFAWPNLRWAALAASVVVVGSVLLLSPEKPTDSTAGAEKLSAQGNAGSPAPETKSDAAAPPAAEILQSKVAPSPQEEHGIVAEKRTAEPGKSVGRHTRAETGAVSAGELADAKSRGLSVDKLSKLRDGDKFALRTPAAPAATAARISTFNQVSPSAQGAAVNGTANESQAAPADGTLVARNDTPAPPIAKAKEAIQEEADLKGQLQKAEPEKKSLMAFETSDSAFARQKQFSKAAKDEAIAQWSLAQGKLRRSLDTGKSWQPVLQPQLPLLSFGARGSDVWAGGRSGILFHSIDAGQTWTMLQPTTKAAALSGDIVSIDVRSATEVVLSTNTGETWTTEDGGKTWDKK